MRRILAIIDVQNDFVSGSLGSARAHQLVVPRIVEKLKSARYNWETIIFTQDRHDKNYLQTHEGRNLPVEHCIWTTPGSQIVDEVLFRAMDATHDIEYLFKSQFGSFDWGLYIDSEVDEIEIVGLVTDICVISNALILRSMFPEMRIVIDASCCAGTTPEKHRAALDVMKSCHIEVINDDLL